MSLLILLGVWWDEGQGVTIGFGNVRSLGTLASADLGMEGMEAEMAWVEEKDER